MDNRSRQIVKPRIVELYIYDLSMGAAALTSLPVLGIYIAFLFNFILVALNSPT